MTYAEARAEAQRKADEFKSDYGVEKNAFGFSCFGLPMAKHRFGHELRCEVVHAMAGPYQPGHGPEAKVCCGWTGCGCSKAH
jgi:hypothetical protein